jgi:hypothetical protein
VFALQGYYALVLELTKRDGGILAKGTPFSIHELTEKRSFRCGYDMIRQLTNGAAE